MPSARVYEAWITGPSAIGSLYGTPSSQSDAPALAIASSTATVAATSGSPAVTKGARAFLPAARLAANTASSLAIGGEMAAGVVGAAGGTVMGSEPEGCGERSGLAAVGGEAAEPGDLGSVFVATAGEADDDDLIG